MKTAFHIILLVIGMGLFMGITTISLGLFDLEWSKFYQPRKENIRRQVFENTQSYVHGKTQDLAKYYEEYRKADETEKSVIKNLIIMRFSDFDTQQLNSPQLRNFLTTIRGY